MKLESVVYAMSWSVIAKVARFLVAIGANILIVRWLGPRNWGILSVLKSIIGFASIIILLGLGNAVLKYIPTVRVKGGLWGLLGNFKKLVLFQMIVWIALLVASRYGSGLVKAFFRKRFESLDDYVQFAVAIVIVEVFLILLTNILQSWYKTRRLGIVVICGSLSYIGLLTLFLSFGWGIYGVLAAVVISNAAMCLLLYPQVRGLIREFPDRPGKPPGKMQILRFSLPFLVGGILNQIVWRQSEVIFLGHFHGPETAGYFGLAYQIPQLLLEFIPLTIWPIILAATAELYAEDRENLPRAISMYYRLLYVLVIPVAAMGFAFSRPLVPLLYGEGMMPSALFTQMFFVVFSYSFLYTPLSMALYVMEKSWVNMLIFLFLAVVNVGLDLALIPRYGLWGAFFPVAFVLVLGVVVYSAVLGRMRPDVKPPAYFILKCYAAAVPTCLMALASMRWSSPVSLALQIPVGALLLLLGFRWMKVIGDEEKEILRRLPIPLKERIITFL